MGLDQNFLFAGMGRCGDHDRAAARHRHQPLQLGRIGGRRWNIELQIARGHDVAAAERRKAIGVELRLREADLEPAEQRRNRVRDPAPARKRALRHPPVDQDHRQPPRRTRQDQVRPQIGLDEQRQRRAPVIEKPRDVARRVVGDILVDHVGGKPFGHDRGRGHRARGQEDAQIQAPAAFRSARPRPAPRRRWRRGSRPAARAAGHRRSCRGVRRPAPDPPCRA